MTAQEDYEQAIRTTRAANEALKAAETTLGDSARAWLAGQGICDGTIFTATPKYGSQSQFLLRYSAFSPSKYGMIDPRFTCFYAKADGTPHGNRSPEEFSPPEIVAAIKNPPAPKAKPAGLTLEQAQAKRYGSWGGRPQGYAYCPEDCAEEVRGNERGAMAHQCSHKHLKGSLYCGTHAKLYA